MNIEIFRRNALKLAELPLEKVCVLYAAMATRMVGELPDSELENIKRCSLDEVIEQCR